MSRGNRKPPGDRRGLPPAARPAAGCAGLRARQDAGRARRVPSRSQPLGQFGRLAEGLGRRGADRDRRPVGAIGERGRGSTCRRVMCSARSARSMKASAWRRRSSAIIAGWVRMVEITVTRTPRRCTASTSRRRSPSPEKITTWSSERGEVEHIDRHLDVHAALDPAPAGGVGELLGRLGDHRIAVVAQPIDQRPQRRILLGLQQRRIVVGAHEVGALPEMRQQVLVVHVESQGPGGGVEVGAVDEDGDPFDTLGTASCALSKCDACRMGTFSYYARIIDL